jgi:hypothetical protein
MALLCDRRARLWLLLLCKEAAKTGKAKLPEENHTTSHFIATEPQMTDSTPKLEIMLSVIESGPPKNSCHRLQVAKLHWTPTRHYNSVDHFSSENGRVATLALKRGSYWPSRKIPPHARWYHHNARSELCHRPVDSTSILLSSPTGRKRLDSSSRHEKTISGSHQESLGKYIATNVHSL